VVKALKDTYICSYSYWRGRARFVFTLIR